MQLPQPRPPHLFARGVDLVYLVANHRQPLAAARPLAASYLPFQFFRKVHPLCEDRIAVGQPDEVVMLGLVPLSARTARSTAPARHHVPPDSYLVLGDNRSASNDSRAWGFAEAGQIVGKVMARYWPLSDFKLF